jgi:hypothetical protein
LFTINIGVECTCQGLYDKIYAPIYQDESAGATTAKKLWEDGRRSEIAYIDKEGCEFYTTCSCCTEYSSWKVAHKDLSADLQKLADQPRYYSVTNEIIEVVANKVKIVYKNTIRALKGAPKGECLKIASTSGPHPYVCDACDALRHGRHSQLNRKLQRETTLRNPRYREDRATKVGVVHKHCSKHAAFGESHSGEEQ